MTDMTKQTEAISTERALKLALEALEIERNVPRLGPVPTKTSKAITALREALTSVPDWASEAKEQPAPVAKPRKQEPVAWLRKSDLVELRACNYMRLGADSPSIWAPNAPDEPSPDMELVAVYTSPPAQRTWVGLTDDEILYCVELENPKAIAEEVEAKLKEKNT